MTTADLARARARVPREVDSDYTQAMAAKRREFVREQTGADLSYVAQYSFDLAILPGNIENFAGVAQVVVRQKYVHAERLHVPRE